MPEIKKLAIEQDKVIVKTEKWSMKFLPAGVIKIEKPCRRKGNILKEFLQDFYSFLTTSKFKGYKIKTNTLPGFVPILANFTRGDYSVVFVDDSFGYTIIVSSGNLWRVKIEFYRGNINEPYSWEVRVSGRGFKAVSYVNDNVEREISEIKRFINVFIQDCVERGIIKIFPKPRKQIEFIGGHKPSYISVRDDNSIVEFFVYPFAESGENEKTFHWLDWLISATVEILNRGDVVVETNYFVKARCNNLTVLELYLSQENEALIPFETIILINHIHDGYVQADFDFRYGFCIISLKESSYSFITRQFYNAVFPMSADDKEKINKFAKLINKFITSLLV